MFGCYCLAYPPPVMVLRWVNVRCATQKPLFVLASWILRGEHSWLQSLRRARSEHLIACLPDGRPRAAGCNDEDNSRSAQTTPRGCWEPAVKNDELDRELWKVQGSPQPRFAAAAAGYRSDAMPQVSPFKGLGRRAPLPARRG